MRGEWSRRAIVVIALCGPIGAAAADAHETKDRVAIDWKRDPKSPVRRGEAPAPAPPPPPADLAVAPGRETGPLPVETGSGPVSAIRAGEEAAHEAARVSGFREYWRAGFGRGVNAALDDPGLGSWDRQEGMRFGRRDPLARELGDHLAGEAAAGAADHDAESRVRERFMDLAGEPRRDRADARGRPRAGADPRFEGPFAVEPALDDVFSARPLIRTPGLSREGRLAMADWRVEPTYFSRAERRVRSYESRWKDAGFAFAAWRERQGRGSNWSRLTAAEREQFRSIFCERFDVTLRSIDLHQAQTAWRIGFEDGWRYGALVQAEWSYRRGYAEGFDLGVAETAAIAYPYAYDRVYSEAYERWFDDWARNAHPGIGGVRLADDSGDGVFEPGERVLVEVDLVNYGGGPGSFELIASGSDVAQPVSAAVRLGGRGRVIGAEKLSLRVSESTALRTRSSVVVTLADQRADAPLYVSRPLELDGTPSIAADRLEGRVTLTVSVSNASHRAAAGVVRVEPLAGAAGHKDGDLGLVPAGASRRTAVTFDGIHPLDLIGAESRWRVSVARGGNVDDLKEVRLAPVATDLANPDLMDFMIGLARTPAVSRRDVQDARALMLERLSADWAHVADTSGNPYKRDFETEGTETVLGQLVRMTRDGGRSFSSPQVFAGMGRDVDALTEELPGAHPLLRKWMKKLAKRLG